MGDLLRLLCLCAARVTYFTEDDLIHAVMIMIINAIPNAILCLKKYQSVLVSPST